MNSRAFVVAVALGLVSMLPVSAQIGAVPVNGRGPTLAERLQQHNIALTTSALVAALRSSDTEVRELAALKLAEDGAKETIPSIEEALTAETAPRAKVNIAFALAQLGNQRGTSALAGTCHNAALKPGPRLLAAQYMLDLSSNACLTAVLDVLQSRDEDDASYRFLNAYSHREVIEEQQHDLTLLAETPQILSDLLDFMAAEDKRHYDEMVKAITPVAEKAS
jgi:hypothetical protein